MSYYEMKMKVYVKEDIHYQEALEKLGNWLSNSFLKDDDLKDLHGREGYKGYSFGNLYPAEKGKVYKEGNLYEWIVRSVDKSLLDKIEKVLDESGNFKKVVVVSKVKREFTFIESLVSVTPVMIREEDGSPTQNEDILKVKRLLENNGEKKAKDFGYVEDDKRESWIKGLEILNNKGPDVTKYKGKKFIGFKYKLYIEEDERSQRIAQAVLGSGLGEKTTAMGSGFLLFSGEGVII